MTEFNKYDYAEQKSWIDSLQITEQQKEYILGKNFLEMIQS